MHPARAARIADVGKQPERRRPGARVVAAVRHEADCVHGLLPAACREPAGQQPVDDVGRPPLALAERVGEAQPVHAAPLPSRGIRPVAGLELVERRPERFEREIVPRHAADQLGVAFLPQLQQPRLEPPRRGGHRREAQLRLRDPAVGLIVVADDGPGDGAREVDREHLVDRARNGVGVEARVPASQPLDRADLALAVGPQPGEPRARLGAGNRVHVGLDSREVIERVALALAQELLDPHRPVAVQVLAGDVVRVVVRGDPVVGGHDRPACWIDHLGQLLVRHVAVPLVLAGPARLREVRAAAAPDRKPADEPPAQ